MKYLLLVVVVALAWWLWRSRSAGPSELPRRPAAPPAQAALPDEEMLACAHCGLHLPRSEGLLGSGGIFCSEAHRRAGPLKGPSP